MRIRLYHHVAAVVALMLLLVTMMNPSAAHAADAKAKTPSHPVQVFDVKAEKVVKSVDNDRQYQKFARSWLKSVTGFAPQLKSDDSCLYVYRVPLNKPTKVKVSQTELNVREVFLFNCANKPPLLLVFDDQRRPYLLLFSADIAPFVKKIGIPS
ncbi:hypothetical protein DFQ01_10451 [Paenibacillus cellulosilyticus]|uniref:Uncharacterized protein n=1 Tax=Paenibacillus cellulosilyticus TaxID=375489 RepID=A0A2V2YW66_9BACL|nr:hypothetical protein [Paenibacillus cellulosilyticus]PWW05493.1 hypothetical protein DFQ01_10451 [Paenibacillus cellulosilyticus]QKS45468.1 hypothetical protein HUB94_14320 [Paenibacillus cellulosilyticus]